MQSLTVTAAGLIASWLKQSTDISFNRKHVMLSTDLVDRVGENKPRTIDGIEPDLVIHLLWIYFFFREPPLTCNIKRMGRDLLRKNKVKIKHHSQLLLHGTLIVTTLLIWLMRTRVLHRRARARSTDSVSVTWLIHFRSAKGKLTRQTGVYHCAIRLLYVYKQGVLTRFDAIAFVTLDIIFFF